MFAWWGRVLVRWRWLVLAAGAAVVLLGATWGVGVFNHLTGGGFVDPASESSQAAARITAELGDQDTDLIVLYRSDTLTVDDPAALRAFAERCEELGLEYVVRVRDDEELEHVLEHVDPEILLLATDAAESEQDPLDRVLELLPDVPAGKLAIAELADASREDVEELERAGVDAVLVTGDVAALVGDGVPDV